MFNILEEDIKIKINKKLEEWKWDYHKENKEKIKEKND